MPVILDDQVNSRAVYLSGLNFNSPQQVFRSVSRFLLPSAYVACLAVFLLGVSRSWQPEVGFTSLIRFGSKFEGRRLDVLKKIPHVVHPDSPGYDGQFYAQLALSPALDNPQLPSAIDDVRYRSRRILFSWTAWLLGVGQPAWVVQAYALQNVLFWLGAAVLLLRWLPPTRWFHFFQWAAILFSRGWLESVNFAILDGPALFLMLLAVWWSDRGRPYWGTALVGVSILGKETNLLGGLVLLRELRLNARGTKDLIIRALLLILPIALWLGVVYFQFGLGKSAGIRNFSAPFGGWCTKIEEMRLIVNENGWTYASAATVVCMLSTIAQITYYATARQWSSKWWRMGAPYALLGVCLGPAVMEGYPGAFTRALLPMLAAYNLSLKPTRLGWLLLVAGNLGVLPGLNLLGLGRVLAFWN